MTSLRKVLEEVHLLKCSLLPGELLEFTEQAALWNELLDAYTLDPECELPTSSFDPRSASAHFQVKLEASSDVWFDVELPATYRIEDEVVGAPPSVSVKGDALGRAEQERWQGIVADAASSVQGSECVPQVP